MGLHTRAVVQTTHTAMTGLPLYTNQSTITQIAIVLCKTLKNLDLTSYELRPK